MSRAVVNGSTFAAALGASYAVLEDGSTMAQVLIGEMQQGPPGYAHGGALAALIDEAMGAAVWYAGHRVLAVHLSFDYKYPVPLGAEVTVSGRVERREGRKVFTSGGIVLADGRAAVSGSGIFVDAPQILAGEITGFSFTPMTDK